MGVEGKSSRLKPPYDVRATFAAACAVDPLAFAIVDAVSRWIALHIAPIAAVVDVGLVVLGGGIGSNGDLLLERVRWNLDCWVPYPPRVEVSTRGEGAVLTGALAYGLRSSLDSVFANGARSARARLSPCSARDEAHPLLWGRPLASRATRGELVELVRARLDDPDG